MKYKVGDRVQIVEDYGENVTIGDLGVVVEVMDDNGFQFYEVEIINGDDKGTIWNFDDNELGPVRGDKLDLI